MYTDPNMYRQVRSRSVLVCGCQSALVNLFCFLCFVYQVQSVLLLLCFFCVFCVCFLWLSVATNRSWSTKDLSGVEKRESEGAMFTLIFETGRR